MPNLSDHKREDRFFGLFIGESGDGKSGQAATYPGPYHEIDCDQRIGGIAGMADKGIVDVKNVSYQQFPRNGGWLPIDKHFTQLLGYRLQARQNIIKFPYGTIGLGSITSLARILLNMGREELQAKKVGGLRLSFPGDYKVESSGVHQVIDWLKDMPCNVICTAHIMDRWGKDKADDNDYAPRVVIGEKLNLTDQLSSSIVSEFDDVYKFSRELIGKEIRYFVEFATDLAKNSYGIPPGKHDITNKKFYPFFQELVTKHKGKDVKV